MGRVIKPGEIKTQTSGMIEALQSDNQVLQDTLPHITEFVESGELQGMAWSSLKTQVSGHQSVIRGLICANESMISDSETLARTVGEEDLIEDEINESILEQQEIIAEYEERIETYRSRIRALKNMPFGSAYIAYAHIRIVICENGIEKAEEIIRELRGKIEKMDAIESATDNLYEGANSLYVDVNAGIEALKCSWTGSGFDVPADMGWKTALDEVWSQREAVNNERARAYLLREGIYVQEIENMEKLGYTAVEIKEAWDCLESGEDREFFRCLMEGTKESYIKAFGMNPNDLSDNMTFILSDYGCHLLQLEEDGKAKEESLKQLEAFNNAVIGIENEKIYYYKFPDGTEQMSSLLYRDIYLEKLYAGTSSLMQGDAAILAAMSPTDKGYAELYQEYTKRVGLTNLWATEAIMIKKLGEKYEQEDHQLNLSELTYQNGDMDFNLTHYSPWEGETVTEKVKTDVLWKTNDLDNEWMHQELERLNQAKEELLQKYLLGTAEGAVLIALGTFAPEVAIIASIGSMAISGEAGAVTGLDSLSGSLSGKLGIKGGNIAAQNVINYWTNISNLENSLSKENFKAKMEWFGMGGTYEYSGGILGEGGDITITGMYRPEVLREVELWEKEGIAGWMGWEKDEGEYEIAEDIMAKIEDEYGEDQNVINGCKKLLLGGYDITKEEDTDKFLDYIDIIQEGYKNAYDSKKINVYGSKKTINIQNEWRELIEIE